MNLMKVLPLVSVVFCCSAFATEQTTYDQNLILGSWNCQHQLEETKTKMKVKVNYNINFFTTGKSNGAGSVFFTLANLPQLECSLKNSATWEIKQGKLILSSTEIESKNISHPELDTLINLDKFIPKSVTESSKIVTLTKSTLEVKSKSDAGVYTCSKVATKR